MSTTQKRAFLVLLAAGFALCAWIVLPVWLPIFLGATLAVTIRPWYQRLVDHVWHRRRRRLAAALLTGASLLVVLGVLALVLWIVARELVPVMTGAVAEVRRGGLESLYHGRVGRWLSHAGLSRARVAEDISRLSEFLATNLAGVITQMLSATTSSLLAIFFTALTCYYLLVDGDRLLRWGTDLSPLPHDQTRSLVREFRDVVRGTLLGTGVTALAQGGLATVGYFALRVPHALTWGALTAVGSLIPGLGTALVWVPIGVVLVATGATWQGVGVLLLGAVVIVGAADYILRPLVVAGQVRLHSLLVFIAIFGGLEAAGLIGLLLGPLAVALFVSLLRIYDRDYRPHDPARPTGPTANAVA